ncbi:MAG: C25 family cysteine peptidase [Bacteroidota bacterium]
MKKFTLSILIFTLFATQAFSSTWTALTSLQNKTPIVTVNKASDFSTTVTYQISGFSQKSVVTPRGKASIIELDNATPLLKAGAPDLCKLTSSFIIPDGATMNINIDESEYTDFPNTEVAPSKGNLIRNVNPESVAFYYGASYLKDEFFPGKLAELRNPYTFRDFSGQTAVIYPFQYNPVKKILRVYTKIKISIMASPSKKGIAKSPSKIDKEFSDIYKRHFLNYSTTRYSPTSEEGNMLIISYGSFMPSMEAFLNWKKQIGIATEIIDVSTIGNAAAIKSYVANYYNTKGLKYLLLVGDAAQVPSSSTTSGDSDNDYGYIVGNDHYPDIFVGRFSAENISDVQTQADRMINYEKNPINSDWLSKGVCIGSTEGGNGSGDDGEVDWLHQRNMRTDLLNFTYSDVKELFDGTQTGGSDDAGDPNPTSVLNEVNKGTGIILYTGHGSDFSFVTSGFSNTNMTSLTNVEKLPFIFSVACVNGNFVNQTCFAEGWLRATYNGRPVGAIGALMSTINQSWNPPMCAQDEMVDILTELQPNNIKRTFGGIAMNGCALMNDEYAQGGYDMTDTWTLFGDPSLMIRTDSAKTMAVTHQSTVPIGTTQLAINCNVEGARIALTMNNEILGTGIVSGGSTTISFTALSIIDTIHVTATAFNYIPYLGDIKIIAPSGPFVIYNTKVIADVAGNNNQQADFSENITLDVTLENVGPADATNINATISTTDAYVTITDNSQSWGTISSSATSTQYNAYALTLANNVPDQHIAPFSMNITDASSNAWTANFNLKINAPALAIGNPFIIDTIAGNSSGKLDAGEAANIIIPSLNNGHANANTTTGVLSTTSTYVSIINSTAPVGTIDAQASKEVSFDILVAPNTPIGTNAEFTYTLTSGSYTVQKTFVKTVGIIDEDFETGDFSKYSWQSGGNSPWVVSSTGMYEGANCSKSGSVIDNQTSVMQVTVNVVAPDSISFYKKVSCEESGTTQQWDFLDFSIDNVSQGWWDGIADWSRSSYAVTTGQHTFTWTYSKDYTELGGEDCAWVDYIVFPPIQISSNINNVNGNAGISIYPNPVNDRMIISIDVQENSNVGITIINTIGQAVYNNTSSRPVGLNSIDINIPQLSEGVYLCKVNANNKVYTKKIIVR